MPDSYFSPNSIFIEHMQMAHAYEREEMHTKLLLENLKGRDNLVDLGVDGITVWKFILEK
jgi:hypothetical protein